MDMTQKLAPWYRQFWPWFLMLFPATAVVAGLITFRMAVTSDDGVVEDDYYKKGMAINRTLARDQAAASAGLLGHLRVSGERLELQLEGRLTAWPAQLRLRILHPTRAGRDQNIVLASRGDGAYVGVCKALGANKWDLVLEDEAKTWRLAGRLAIGRHDTTLVPGE